MRKPQHLVVPAGAAVDEKLDTLPIRPGVYLLKDRHGKVMYVGKAKSLRSRVRSYFRGGDERSQIRFLVQKICDFECLVTSNDKEALILENNLIKQYKPRYNIRLKDDKSYVSVKVTLQDDWPRILVTRKIVKDGSRYFGPFASAWSVRETLDTIRKLVPLRTCSDGVFRHRSRPCLEYQIRRCLAPCCLPVDREQYDGHLREAMLLLSGKRVLLVDQLRASMQVAASELRFEDAARLRDRLRAIENTQERQQAVSHGGGDQDIFGFYREGGFIEAEVLFVRQGKLTGNQVYRLDDFDFPDEEVVHAVVSQFYQSTRLIPDEVLLPLELDGEAGLADYLSERKGRRVEILRPQRGDRVRLLEMARANAMQSFRERQDGEKQYERTSEELRRQLRLRNAPKRIECFDVSNIQGSLAVASMVTFDEGKPDTSRYRRFRIKTVVGADDFRMMYEALHRRFSRARERGEYPDLLIVDGGKGQLNVAVQVLRDLEIDVVDAVGLAKSRVTRAPRDTQVERSEERVFLPGRVNPVILRRNSNALFLLQRLRDEAHRFAVTYHRTLRGKDRLSSVLDQITGIGAERRRRLLVEFGSVRRLRGASVEEIAQVPGISDTLAGVIHQTLEESAVRERSIGRGRLRLVPSDQVAGGGVSDESSASDASAPGGEER